MGALFIYILKSGICLALFYLFYRLLLSKETFHRFNRIALLGVLGLSVLLPSMKYTYSIKSVQPSSESVLLVEELQLIPIERLLPLLQQHPVVEETQSGSLYICILLLIYLAGVCFFLIQTGWGFFVLFHLSKTGHPPVKRGDVKIYITEKNISPFSWMNRMVISKKDWEENGEEILSHETGHCRCGHSWDLLFIHLCVIFHWFNPAAWLLKQELQNIHEFEADEYVLNKGINAKQYQLLLIKKAVGTQRFTSMANSFNHSKLKKRITMMLKSKSNPWARLKYLYVLPVSLLVVTVFARPEITEPLEKISAVKISEIFPEDNMPEKTDSPQKGTDNKHVEVVKIESGNSSNGDTAVFWVKGVAEITLETEEKTDDREACMRGISSIGGILEDSLVLIDGEEGDYLSLEIDDIQTFSVLKGASGTSMYGEKGKNGLVLITTKKAVAADQSDVSILEKEKVDSQKDKEDVVRTGNFSDFKIDENCLFIIDGEESDYESLQRENIFSLSVMRAPLAIEKYGEKGKNGVVFITTKKEKEESSVSTKIIIEKKVSADGVETSVIKDMGDVPLQLMDLKIQELIEKEMANLQIDLSLLDKLDLNHIIQSIDIDEKVKSLLDEIQKEIDKMVSEK